MAIVNCQLPESVAVFCEPLVEEPPPQPVSIIVPNNNSNSDFSRAPLARAKAVVDLRPIFSECLHKVPRPRTRA